MKNITLSLPEDLLQKSRAYARRHHTTLNELVRNLLRDNVERENNDLIAAIFAEMDKIPAHQSATWTREELYER